MNHKSVPLKQIVLVYVEKKINSFIKKIKKLDLRPSANVAVG